MKNTFIVLTILLAAFKSFSQVDLSIRRGIVKIHSSIPYNYEYRSTAGSYTGTGFIVNLDKNIIITNRHLVPRDSDLIQVEFYNGIKTNANLIYSDPIIDISILKFEENLNIPTDVIQLNLGIEAEHKNGDRVFVTGYDEAQSFSILEGTIIDDHVTDGLSNGLNFQVKLRSEGGSSGSPVLNKNGKVIGVHFSGTKSTSFEISSLHIVQVLNKVDSLKKTYFLAAQLSLQEIGQLLPKYKEYKEIILNHFKLKNFNVLNNRKKMISIKNIRQVSPLFRKVEDDDLILKINNKKIYSVYDAYNEISQNEYLSIDFLTQTGLKKIEGIKGIELKTGKVPHVIFSGGVFKEADELDSFFLNSTKPLAKVMCTFALNGSPFHGHAYRLDEKGAYAFLVSSINGTKIKDLNHFYNVVKNINDKEKIYIGMIDLSDNSTMSNFEVVANRKMFNFVYIDKETSIVNKSVKNENAEVVLKL